MFLYQTTIINPLYSLYDLHSLEQHRYRSIYYIDCTNLARQLLYSRLSYRRTREIQAGIINKIGSVVNVVCVLLVYSVITGD